MSLRKLVISVAQSARPALAGCVNPQRPHEPLAVWRNRGTCFLRAAGYFLPAVVVFSSSSYGRSGEGLPACACESDAACSKICSD